MNEDKPTIQVISTGERRAQIVIKRRGTRRGKFTSETHHLWQSAGGYTDREGNIYRERGGTL